MSSNPTDSIDPQPNPCPDCDGSGTVLTKNGGYYCANCGPNIEPNVEAPTPDIDTTAAKQPLSADNATQKAMPSNKVPAADKPDKQCEVCGGVPCQPDSINHKPEPADSTEQVVEKPEASWSDWKKKHPHYPESEPADTDEEDFNSPLGQLLSEAYIMGEHDVRNGCLVPLVAESKRIITAAEIRGGIRQLERIIPNTALIIEPRPVWVEYILDRIKELKEQL